MLSFQAECRTESVNNPSLAVHASVQMVAGVKLHTRLRRVYFQSASAVRVCDSRGQRQSTATAVQSVVMIESKAKLQLLAVFVESLSDLLWCAEIEWRSRNGAQLASRDQVLIDRSEFIGINHHEMFGNTS